MSVGTCIISATGCPVVLLVEEEEEEEEGEEEERRRVILGLFSLQ